MDSSFYVALLPIRSTTTSINPDIQAFFTASSPSNPTLDDILAILLTHRQTQPFKDRLLHFLACEEGDHYVIMRGSQFPNVNGHIDRGLQELESLHPACMRVLHHYHPFDDDDESPLVLKAPSAIYDPLDCPWPLDSQVPLYIVLFVRNVSVTTQVACHDFLCFTILTTWLPLIIASTATHF